MISNSWIALRKDNWSRLETLVQQAESAGLKTLAAPDLRQFGLLYRQAAADLSAVRTDQGARTLEDYLNRLVARAHNFVYAGRRFSPRSIWRFMALEYPRLFRKLLPYTAVSFALCLVSGVVGALVILARPDSVHLFLPPQMIDTIQQHKMWTDSILGAEPQNSSGIMTNNISVCFMTFAAGVTAGLGTVYVLLRNGFSIGMILAVCFQHGLGLSLVSFMAAHGALELPSIFISGGAGLRLGAGMLFPGFLKRRDAMARAASDAVRLVAGTVPLLVIAGTLEAFLSPQKAPMALKFGVSAVLFTALTLWLSEGWRRPLAKA